MGCWCQEGKLGYLGKGMQRSCAGLSAAFGVCLLKRSAMGDEIFGLLCIIFWGHMHE